MAEVSDRCAVLWFRRDLRLADHPALLAAADRGDYPLPIVDHKTERQEALRRYGEYVTGR